MFPSPANFNLYPALRGLIQRYEPKSYLEIGVSDGSSLGCVVSADVNKNISRIALCDTWGGEYGGTNRGGHGHIDRNLRDAGYNGTVEFYDGNSQKTVPTIPGKFDLILVDGDHSEDGCRIDMENTWPLLNNGGIMVIDDICHPRHLYCADVVDKFVLNHIDEAMVLIFDKGQLNGVAAIQRLYMLKGTKENGTVSKAKKLPKRID